MQSFGTGATTEGKRTIRASCPKGDRLAGVLRRYFFMNMRRADN
jgi:hypothetical protein